jgi:hypothetical protein
LELGAEIGAAFGGEKKRVAEENQDLMHGKSI